VLVIGHTTQSSESALYACDITAGLAKAKQQCPALTGFLPAVASASKLPGAKIEHYKHDESYARRRATPGVQGYHRCRPYVQIDDAFLPSMRERMVPPMSHPQPSSFRLATNGKIARLLLLSHSHKLSYRSTPRSLMGKHPTLTLG